MRVAICQLNPNIFLMIRSSASLKYRLMMNSRKWVRLWNKYLHFSIWVDPAFLRCGRFSGRMSKQTCQISSLIRHVCVNQKQVCVRLVKTLQSSCPAASGRWKSGNLSCRPTTGSYQMVFLFWQRCQWNWGRWYYEDITNMYLKHINKECCGNRHAPLQWVLNRMHEWAFRPQIQIWIRGCVGGSVLYQVPTRWWNIINRSVSLRHNKEQFMISRGRIVAL